MLWAFGGDFYQIQTPNWLTGPIQLPFVTAIRSSGEAVYLQYPLVRLVIFVASVVIGVVMWLALNRTRIGMIVRAGVDDRDILAATGVQIQLVFVIVFALGAGLAGIAGVVGGTFQSISPGEDTRFLLASLVVVIVGGMSGNLVGELILWLIVAIVAIVIAVYIVNWLYHRSSKEVSFVRTGFLGERVVINGGAFVLPFIHDYTPVNMPSVPSIGPGTTALTRIPSAST